MLSSISNVLFQNDLDDESLLKQINEALQEIRTFWENKTGYIDPIEINRFQEKWRSAYETAKQKTSKLSYIIGITGKELRKVIPEFIGTYEQLPVILQDYNEKVANEKAKQIATLILPVENRQLDSQQLRCIAKEAHNHLVLAGAGTGKTTTIIGYVKYIIKANLCSPSKILVLSFTNASAAEMSQRLSAELGLPITALTFHKLGLDIISSVEGKKPKIYSSDIRQFVRNQLKILVQDLSYLKKLCIYLTYNSSNQKNEFDFAKKEDYDAYLKYNPPITLKKEQVKSYGELDIANFLTQNGISYVYEQPYKVDTRTSEYGQYHPDFYLPDFDIYIEYFGINKKGEVPSYFSGRNGMTASQAYAESMKWKRNLHHMYGTRMIEVYAYEKFEEKLLTSLEKKLKEANVVFNPVSSKELWDKISGSDNQKLDRVAELFATVITLIKTNNCTLDDILIRNRSFRNLPSIYTIIDLIKPIYKNYQDMLRSNGEIDFNDMINSASEYVKRGKFVHHFDYVIVDEYQDISQSRYRLLNALREQGDFKLFCVGDDWQSIFRFSGSDIGFILNFEKYWGASEISRIETTYRFPSSLISVSSDFIMKNPEQTKKHLKSAVKDSGFSLEKITGYTDNYAAQYLIERLSELPQNSTVLFLGRYRFDIKILDEQPSISYNYNISQGNTIVVFNKRPDLIIKFMTIHSSKGLQADYVFVLNNKAYGMGFPSQISDAPILQLLLDNCDHYPFAEERRLFYVAITRAKKKVWLVTLKNNESMFVKELNQVFGSAMKKEQYMCPLCGGRLVKRKGPYGEFLGCSNYKTNGCRYIRKKTLVPSNSIHKKA